MNSTTTQGATQQTEVAFTQSDGPPPLHTIKCYNCNVMGHYASSCPLPQRTRADGTTTGVQMLQHTGICDEESEEDNTNFCFSLQNNVREIDTNWILLDSESTVSIFRNGRLLKNIRESENPKGLRVYGNGGSQDAHLVGDLPGFGPVWYNPQSLANILLLAEVRKLCRVTMDTSLAAAMNGS